MPERQLRCHGGPHDGQKITFPGGVDEMMLPDPMTTDDEVRLMASPGTTMKLKRTLYTVRQMKTPDGFIEFAAPASMTTFEVLKRALT